MNEDEFAELAAGHALHALSAADEKRFQDALTEHPEWGAQAASDEETAAALGQALSPVMPPPAVRDRLLSAISAGAGDAMVSGQEHASAGDAVLEEPGSGAAGFGSTQSAGEGDASGVTARKRWRRRLFALAASFVLLVGLGVGAAVVIPQLLQPPAVSALEQIRTADDARQASVQLPEGGAATAHWSAELGSVVLVADGLEDLGAEKTYELWFVRGDAPVAAGTFRPEGGDATALLEGRMRDGDVIAVTIEPAGGSPTGKPTGEPIIVIPTA